MLADGAVVVHLETGEVGVIEPGISWPARLYSPPEVTFIYRVRFYVDNRIVAVDGKKLRLSSPLELLAQEGSHED